MFLSRPENLTKIELKMALQLKKNGRDKSCGKQ